MSLWLSVTRPLRTTAYHSLFMHQTLAMHQTSMCVMHMMFKWNDCCFWIVIYSAPFSLTGSCVHEYDRD